MHGRSFVKQYYIIEVAVAATANSTTTATATAGAATAATAAATTHAWQVVLALQITPPSRTGCPINRNGHRSGNSHSESTEGGGGDGSGGGGATSGGNPPLKIGVLMLFDDHMWKGDLVHWSVENKKAYVAKRGYGRSSHHPHQHVTHLSPLPNTSCLRAAARQTLNQTQTRLTLELVLATSEHIDASRPAAWSKISAMKAHLHDFDYLFFTDIDTLVMNMEVSSR